MKIGFNSGLRTLCGGLPGRKDGIAKQPRGGRGRSMDSVLGREDGNALVEFALTLPILMVVLVAIFEFGMAFNNQLQLTNAVGAGAQYLQQLGTSSTDPCNDVYTTIKNSAPNLTPASISLTLNMGGTKVTGNSCSGDQSDLVPGGSFTVSATYPCNIALFGISLGGIYTWNFSCNLSAQSTEFVY
jgi:Flp pilus assembly protein TadG